jgi:nucleotide-binding universal stress UspA family protein
MVRDSMSNFKKILVALDGTTNSFRGLDRAIYLARQFHTTITGLYVVPMDKPYPSDPITSMEKLFLENAAKFMEKAKKKAAQNGILFIDKIVYGDDGVEIVRFAKRNNFDIIVIGSRGISLVKEIFIGGTSNYVLHKAPMPVMIVK